MCAQRFVRIESIALRAPLEQAVCVCVCGEVGETAAKCVSVQFIRSEVIFLKNFILCQIFNFANHPEIVTGIFVDLCVRVHSNRAL